MNEFNIGDKVYASDWCYGTIIDIDGDIALVEFENEMGGGTIGFELRELEKEDNE